MAWDLFFGSATVCYCPTDTNGVWKIPEIDYCFCSTAWDMDKWPLALFYAFAGLSAIMFMMSTIFAVVQILMVYEMSDEAEVEVFLCEYCRGCRCTHTHAQALSVCACAWLAVCMCVSVYAHVCMYGGMNE